MANSNRVDIKVISPQTSTSQSPDTTLSIAENVAYAIADYIMKNGIGSVNNNNFSTMVSQFALQYGDEWKSMYGIAPLYNEQNQIIGADVFLLSGGNLGKYIVYTAYIQSGKITSGLW